MVTQSLTASPAVRRALQLGYGAALTVLVLVLTLIIAALQARILLARNRA